MISLCFFIAITLLSLVATAWALAWSARRVGSLRGRFRVGLLAAFLILLINISFTFIGEGMARSFAEPMQALAIGVFLLIAQMVVVFALLKRTFKLCNRRTFAPMGAFIALALLQVVLALFILRPFLVEAFVMPSKGMSPTIEPNDRFVVNKVIQPKRWDLIAYWSSDRNPMVYCQRLIGLPGEQLRFDQGEIYINDKLVAAPAALAGRLHASPKGTPERYVLFQDGESIMLGDNEFFLVGDNLEISADSRINGPSDASSIVGVADLMYWPPSKTQIVR
ncbi:MAG: signal peptidase I [Chthoniobacterales bacterium]|nr:signal peptidase I [Chthoniobacterales bacterium]